MKLFAPNTFWEASTTMVNDIAVGCGPGSGWKEKLVPDTMYGLDISEACVIHDWMYYEGETHEDKERADRVFMNNLNRIIGERGKNSFIFTNFLRRRRATTYYRAVKYFGGSAFWNGKDDKDGALVDIQKLERHP